MLEQIVLQQFQKHTKLIVNLDPRITAITGPSDKGKTTILRALWWIAANRIGGKKDSFIQRGKRKARVGLFVDGHHILRTKGKGVNSYKLDGKSYKAMGTNVPDAIAQLLNLSDLNFSFQFDPPFWFTLSPGQLAKELNQIVNLEVIDTTLANLAAKVRRSKAEVEVSQSRLKEARKKKKELAWIKEADREYRRVERLQKLADEKRSSFESAERRLRECVRLHSEAASAAEAKADASMMLETLQHAQQAAERVRIAKRLIRQIKEKDEEIWQQKQRLKELEKKRASVTVCPVCEQPIA